MPIEFNAPEDLFGKKVSGPTTIRSGSDKVIEDENPRREKIHSGEYKKGLKRIGRIRIL